MKKLGAEPRRCGAVRHRRSEARQAGAAREYLPAFDPSFLGLYGDAEATSKATRDFRIYAQERPGKTPGSYTVDPAAQTSPRPKGKLRLLRATDGAGCDRVGREDPAELKKTAPAGAVAF